MLSSPAKEYRQCMFVIRSNKCESMKIVKFKSLKRKTEKRTHFAVNAHNAWSMPINKAN